MDTSSYEEGSHKHGQERSSSATYDDFFLHVASPETPYEISSRQLVQPRHRTSRSEIPIIPASQCDSIPCKNISRSPPKTSISQGSVDSRNKRISGLPLVNPDTESRHVSKPCETRTRKNIHGRGASNFKERRALSVDGDSTHQFSLRHIVRPEFLDVNRMYIMAETIGEGSSGTVRRCIERLTGESFACKTIIKSSLKYQLDVDDLKAEVHILQTMQKHKDVVRLKGIFEDLKNVHLVMDFCGGGDLFSRIKQCKTFSEQEAAMVCKKVASVLAFAHSRNVMHRDLKPENILMSSTVSNTDIKMADFGSATFFKPGQKMNQLVGSPLYIAPSVLQHNYGPDADLWSLGVILYIMLSGHPPFFGTTNAEIFKSIQWKQLDLNEGKIRNASRKVKNLLESLLSRNPTEKLSASEVLCHPWIKSLCPDELPNSGAVQSLQMQPEITRRVVYEVENNESSDEDEIPLVARCRRHSLSNGEIECIPIHLDDAQWAIREKRMQKSVLLRVAPPFDDDVSDTNCSDWSTCGSSTSYEDMEHEVALQSGELSNLNSFLRQGDFIKREVSHGSLSCQDNGSLMGDSLLGDLY